MSARNDTIVTIFDRMRKAYPNKECYVAYDGNMTRKAVTFQEMWTLCARYAYILREHGLRRGDYVVVVTPHSLEHMVAAFGVILAGGSQIPMERFFAKCQMIEETLKLSKSKYLVLSDDTNCDAWDHFKVNGSEVSRDTMSANYKSDQSALTKVLFTPKAMPEPGSWKMGFLDYLRQCTKEFIDRDLTPQDGAITVASLNPGVGVPKLVEHSHASIIDHTIRWNTVIDSRPRHWPYPMYLIAMLPYCLLSGRTRIITDFQAIPITDMTKHLIDVRRAEKLTSVITTPAQVLLMVDSLKSEGAELPLYEEVLSGGMPITCAFFDRARDLFESVKICYVASETGLVSVNKIGTGGKFSPFDSGIPLEGVQVRILDENNEPVERGRSGQICVKSASLFLRYVGEPEKDKVCYTKDGWYMTGDAGSIGSGGQLFVYGRKSEAISRGIVLTYPPWLEKPIASHPEILEVTVVPVPDVANFYNTCACVVKKPGSKVTEKELLDLVRDVMSADGNEYFVLDYVVFFEGTLPKLARDRLGEKAAKRLGLTPY